MRCLKFKRCPVLIIALVLLFSMAMTAYATTASMDSDGDGTDELSFSETNGNSITISDVSVTMSVSVDGGFGGASASNTITITNISGSRGTLTFGYTCDKDTSMYTITGVATNTGANCSVLMEPGASISIELKASAGWFSSDKTTFNMTDVKFTPVADSADVTVSFLGAGSGSVSLSYTDSDGVSQKSDVTGETTVTVDSSGIQMTAAPASGSAFLGWVDTDNRVLSKELSYSTVPGGNMTIRAVFAGTDPWYYAVDTGYLTNSMSTAFDRGNTVALANSAVLPAGDYTVPAGKVLVIPFDSANTYYTDKPDAAYSGSQTNPKLYRKLTMAEGAKLTVNGTLSVPAKVFAGAGSQYVSSAPQNAYGQIDMTSGSSITVNSNGILSVFGFITGDGTITAESGAKVYESFQLSEFRGGSATSSMNSSKKVFPFSQYYIQNIEAPMTLKAGAEENAYVALYMSDTVIGTQVSFIGTSGCMFNLTTGSLTKYYDRATDRLIVDIEGDMAVSNIEIKIKQIITVTIDSGKFPLPINGNMTVNINSGTTTINQDLAFLPGTELNIAQGATFKVGSGKHVYVYDLDQWKGQGYCFTKSDLVPVFYVPDRVYKRSAADLKDAQINVSGTLDATAGYLYTTTGSTGTEGGAAITGTEGGKVLVTKGSKTITNQATQVDGVAYVDIPLSSAKLMHADGAYLNTGVTSAAETYTYTSNKWTCQTHAYDAGVVTTPATCTTEGVKTITCNACGHSYTETIAKISHSYTGVVTTQPTCTTPGVQTFTCTCGETYTEEVATTAHTEETIPAVAATCTGKGLTEGKKCSVCGTITVAQTEIDALGHTEEAIPAVDATCTTAGSTAGTKCSVCGEVLKAPEKIEAKAHTEEIIPGKDATCTEKGLTEGKKCSVCGEIIVAQTEIDALGHTYGAPEWTWAEGYTEAQAKFSCDTCSDVQTLIAKPEGYTPGEGEADPDGTITVVTTPATTEAEGSSVYTASISFNEQDYTDTKTVVIPMLSTKPTISFVDKTGNSSDTIIGGTAVAPEDKGQPIEITVDADGTFEVSHEKACVVIVTVTNDDGTKTYKQLKATATGTDNTYDFGIEGIEGELEVTVALKGDVNGDGKVNVRDQTMIARSMLGTGDSGAVDLTEIQNFVADVNGDGKINVRDQTSIARSMLGADASGYYQIAW